MQAFTALLAAALLTTSALAQTPAHSSAARVLTEKSPADLAHAQILGFARGKSADPAKVVELTFAAYNAYPGDPRFASLLPQIPSLASSLPEAERASFRAEYAHRLAAEMEVAGLLVERWGMLAAADLSNTQAIENAAIAPNPAAVRAKIDVLAARLPESRALPSAELAYARLLDRVSPAAALAHLRSLVASANQTLAAQAAGELRVRDMRVNPLEMKFTAADGRSVDFAQLRGKVVLIDFWATWCGPCIAELPNLKRVYETYHDRGFEIVGISFENSRFAPDDSFEVRNEKIATAKAKLLAFTKTNAMPWPQHFDGKFWDNEYGRRYNIRGIPAMFLLNKEGILIETNARGEKLEQEVKRLLNL